MGGFLEKKHKNKKVFISSKLTLFSPIIFPFIPHNCVHVVIVTYVLVLDILTLITLPNMLDHEHQIRRAYDGMEVVPNYYMYGGTLHIKVMMIEKCQPGKYTLSQYERYIVSQHDG